MSQNHRIQQLKPQTLQKENHEYVNRLVFKTKLYYTALCFNRNVRFFFFLNILDQKRDDSVPNAAITYHVILKPIRCISQCMFLRENEENVYFYF